MTRHRSFSEMASTDSSQPERASRHGEQATFQHGNGDHECFRQRRTAETDVVPRQRQHSIRKIASSAGLFMVLSFRPAVSIALAALASVAALKS